MMYIHYCKYCQRIHILNGHKNYCPRCRGHLAELKISYLKYVNLDLEARRALRDRCADPRELAVLTALPQKSHDYAKGGGGSVSKVENYHSEHYAAYSH